MNASDLPSGAAIFLDANTLVYYFGSHPDFGPACRQLMERIQAGDLLGWTSTQAMTDLAHRLMVLEAVNKLGWAVAGMVRRFRDHPAEVRKLTLFRTAVRELSESPVRLVCVTPDLVVKATAVSQETGLLTGDALIVAIMRQHGLSNIASHDADFDAVPDITRYAPV